MFPNDFVSITLYYKTFLSFISQLLNNVLFSFFFLFSSSTLSHFIIFIRYLFLLSSPFSLSLSLSPLSVSCCCFSFSCYLSFLFVYPVLLICVSLPFPSFFPVVQGFWFIPIPRYIINFFFLNQNMKLCFLNYINTT